MNFFSHIVKEYVFLILFQITMKFNLFITLIKHHSVIYSKRESARENHPSDVDFSINFLRTQKGRKRSSSSR
jgi:hypothetical protein